MTDRKQHSTEQLQQIADAIWGTGLFRPDQNRYQVPCPCCGLDIDVYIDGVRGLPYRFRAICRPCGLDSTGTATSIASRRFTAAEMAQVLELHLRGQQTFCRVCQAPLRVEDLEVAGAGPKTFDIRCFRCGTLGQTKWPPPEDQLPE